LVNDVFKFRAVVALAPVGRNARVAVPFAEKFKARVGMLPDDGFTVLARDVLAVR
jgi:hypothetical protein